MPRPLAKPLYYRRFHTPMPIIILIPTVLCIIALFRDSVQKVVLNLYLPIFMLFPIYYFWKVAALPPIDLSEAVLLPLGVAIVLKELPRWRLSLMDVFVGLFIFTACYADSLADRAVASNFELFANLCVAGVPYAVGKLLLEKDGARTAIVKRIVFCLFIASILSAYEYRMGQNPFTLVWSRFFPDESFAWKTQIRWGFGRVSGPYGQSELAGMMLFSGLVLTLYLSFYDLWEDKFSRALWLPLKKHTVIAWTIGITLFMTQARGPWLGGLVAVPIALIGRTRRVLLASVLFGSLCLVCGPLSYLGFKHYTDAPATSSEQETAQYREHLIDNYLPVAKQGGPWGWGSVFPRAPGQGSIDNEYLFIGITQGWVGLLAFCLIGVHTVINLVLAAIYNPRRQDRYFAFSLLGITIGMLLTIYTVFLGNQPYELFFLLAGWSQAVRVRRAEQTQLAFQQVYT